MPGRLVGLDIGTHAVRAAELAVGRGVPTLQRFGQVALPEGAVVAGEVVDAATVGAAVRRLWKETGFSTRQVTVGVGNQRVVVRQADMPDMPAAELRSAIRFQAQELIPIPIDEAVLDFQILQHVDGPEGERVARLLIAAAQQDMVRTMLAAVQAGGLEPTHVDLVPFALIRSLGELTLPPTVEVEPIPPLTPDEASYAPTVPAPIALAEAIVCVGSGVTNLVVHEQGIPQFVRILTLGGNDLSRAISDELGVHPEVAEDLKRRVGDATTDEEQRAARVVATHLAPFLDEVRGSLDYYQAQGDAAGLRRVVLTGGGSRIPGLADRLAGLLGVPVVRGNPLADIGLGRTGLTDEQLASAQDLLGVPIGLALAGQPTVVHRITLLPAELTIRRAERQQTVVAGVAVAALAALLLLLWVLRGSQVNDERAKASLEEATTGQLRQELASLGDVSGLEGEISDRQATVEGVLQGDVAWTRLLQEISTVIPNDVWLTSFEGARGDPSTVAVSGRGLDFTSAARWLMRIGDLPAIEGLWLPSSSRDEQGIVTFDSTANLTPSAASNRVGLYTGETADGTDDSGADTGSGTDTTTTTTETDTTDTTDGGA